MKKQPLVVMLILAGTLGCATTLWWGSKSTTLSFGMSKEQVQALFGPPQQAMTQELHGMMVETWRYADRIMTFQNGVLQSWSTQPSRATDSMTKPPLDDGGRHQP